jgi:hypothetical protein
MGYLVSVVEGDHPDPCERCKKPCGFNGAVIAKTHVVCKHCLADMVQEGLGLEPLQVVKVKGEVWVNVYRDGHFFADHTSKEAADRAADEGRIACKRLEFEFEVEEGEGLNK